MGTRGFYCLRYKGLYYVIYNHWDSYPEALGEKLVNQLRNLDPQDLRNLLENIIIVVEDRQENQYPILSSDIVEKFRNIILQDPIYFEDEFLLSPTTLDPPFQRKVMSDASMFSEWINNTFGSQEKKWRFLFATLFAYKSLRLDKALSFGFIPVFHTPDVTAPENDLFIEWIYVIDLDNETFLVKDGPRVSEFSYHNIPQNWISKFIEENE